MPAILRCTKQKSNQWYFGMRAHVGTDSHTGIVHSLKGAAANVADVTRTHHLLHGDGWDVFCDAGYQGAKKRRETVEDALDWHIAMRRDQRRALTADSLDQMREATKQAKLRVRARGKHAFHVSKKQLGCRKVRYRGIAENKAQLYTLLALANRTLAQRQMSAPRGRDVP